MTQTGSARAVLANSRGLVQPGRRVDSERVEALEAAAEALPDDDPRRAQVLALLARSCTTPANRSVAGAGRRSDRDSPSRRRSGRARAHARLIACLGDLGARHAAAAQTADRRAARAGAAPERPVVELLGGWVSSRRSASRAGDRSQVESGLRADESAGGLRPGAIVHLVRGCIDESRWAFTQGDLQQPSSGRSGVRGGERIGRARCRVVFRSAAVQCPLLQQGRSGEFVEQAVQLAGRPGQHRGVARGRGALLDRKRPRRTEARELVLAEDFRSVPWDVDWSGALFIWADVCSRLGLGDRAGEVYELLAPFSGQLASGGSLVSGRSPRRSARSPRR